MSETDTSGAARAAEFERWANVFTAHKAFSHPSELHGALCGRLAAGSRIEEPESEVPFLQPGAAAAEQSGPVDALGYVVTYSQPQPMTDNYQPSIGIPCFSI